jgi:hypothetical protein
LGFSGLRGFGSRASFLVGGQERSPKTQPFHIVKRCVLLQKEPIKIEPNLLILRFKKRTDNEATMKKFKIFQTT